LLHLPRVFIRRITMAKVAEVKKDLQKTEIKSIVSLIEASTNQLEKALPKHMSVERFKRITLTTFRLNPEIAKCVPESIMGALFQCAQTGLEPGLDGQAFILPFNNKRKQADGTWVTKKEAQFMIGYKGYRQLFYRHELGHSIEWGVVKENDLFEFERGTNSYLRHKEADSNRGDTIRFYAIAKLSNGASIFETMTKEECIAHGKKHSKCYDKKNDCFFPKTPWVTEETKMCLKTVFIQLQALLPKSIELQRAIAMDNTVKYVDINKFVPNDLSEEPDHTNWNDDDVKETEAEVVDEPKQKRGKPTKKDIENMTAAERRAAEKAEEEAFMRSEEVKVD